MAICRPVKHSHASSTHKALHKTPHKTFKKEHPTTHPTKAVHKNVQCHSTKQRAKHSIKHHKNAARKQSDGRGANVDGVVVDDGEVDTPLLRHRQCAKVEGSVQQATLMLWWCRAVVKLYRCYRLCCSVVVASCCFFVLL